MLVCALGHTFDFTAVCCWSLRTAIKNFLAVKIGILKGVIFSSDPYDFTFAPPLWNLSIRRYESSSPLLASHLSDLHMLSLNHEPKPLHFTPPHHSGAPEGNLLVQYENPL